MYRVRRSLLKDKSNTDNSNRRGMTPIGGNQVGGNVDYRDTDTTKIQGKYIPNVIDKYGDEGRDKACVELMSSYHRNKKNNGVYTHEYGPGWWDVIHKAARNAKDTEGVSFFIKLMDFAAENFGCPICRKHMILMWTKYKSMIPGFYRHANKDTVHYGMFLITWEMHNEVNKRLGKPLMGWADATYIYYSSEVDKPKLSTDDDCDNDEVCDN